RILLPPSRRSRHNRTHFTLRAMHSFTPTVLASSRFRLARDCRQSSVSANLSKPERSCPTDQTSRISSGAPPNWSTKFCAGRSRATSRSSSRLRGRYETRCKPMQCECLVDRPGQGLVRCANKATQRLTISHLKIIRLLACEACGARKLAWAEPYGVVVEP